MTATQNAFETAVDHAQIDQLDLLKIYRSEIGLINELKKQSKLLMNKLSNIEEVSLSNKDNELIDATIDLLCNKMHAFNHEIEVRQEGFIQSMSSFIEHTHEALNLYNEGKGQLTTLLKIRRELLYMEVLLDKVRAKLTSLLLMNNALLTFSPEIAKEKDVYRSNLISIKTSMLSAKEDCKTAIQCIELLQ